MAQQASLLAQLLPEPSPMRQYVHPSRYRADENVRLYADGMHKMYQPNLVTLAIAVVTLGLYISVPHIMMGLFAAAFFSRTALVLLVVTMVTLLLPAKPLRVPSVLSSYVFLCWRRYFKFSYLFESNLDSYQDYIIAQFPHGAFPIGALLGGTFMATQYPEYPCYALAANAAFLVPFWRHVHAWLGTEACTKTNFHKLLSKGVKGPLPAKQHHSHSHSHSRPQSHTQVVQQQQQQQGGDDMAATCDRLRCCSAPAGPNPTQQQQQQQQHTSSTTTRPISAQTPFNSCAAALAAAADGVAASEDGAAASVAVPPFPRCGGVCVGDRLVGPFASAAVLTGCGGGGALTARPSQAAGEDEAAAAGGCATTANGSGAAAARGGVVPPRRTFSAPLGRRLSQALESMSSSLFRAGHTLSDSESSESESESEGSEGSHTYESEAAGAEEEEEVSSSSHTPCCGCGSGLRCKDTHTCRKALQQQQQQYEAEGPDSRRSSDSGSSISSSGASLCSCCGAVTVLAEVQSLPLTLDGFGSIVNKPPRQSQHSRLTIPSGELQKQQQQQQQGHAVTAVDDADDNDCDSHTPLLQQQQRMPRRLSVSAAGGGHAAQQQQQQQLSRQQEQQQLQRHDQSNRSNWQLDPRTGARKLGVAVGLMVGGIAEMFMIREDHERIKLRDRKGFVRIAVEHGVDILPVYMFGVNQALAFGPPWLQRVSRKMRASLGVIYGVWGLPIPRRVPIFQVTGHPLKVGPPMRKDHPGFAARVDELHAQFCAEMERIYYTHRGKYGHGFENRPLVIC